MAWVSYRKVIDCDVEHDFSWVGFPCPELTYNQRWPFIINANGLPCNIANQFLLEEPIYKGRTEATLQTYAESLTNYFSYLESKNLNWDEVSKYDLFAYRESTRLPTKGNKPLSHKTINLRISVVDSFYQWVYTHFPGLSSKQNDSKSIELLSANYMTSSLVKTPRLKTFKGTVRAPTSIDAMEFITSLPEPYDLMAKWQILTGLRASGIRNLSLKDLKNTRQCNKSLSKLLIKEKPNKPRNIYIPNFLINETRAYIKTTRKANRTFSLHTPKNRWSDEVIFINTRARPISKASYCNVFNVASAQHKTKITSHMLRSTFATTMLAVLKRLEREGLPINPLLVVRDLLGHSWISTTEKYLNNMEVEIAMDTLYASDNESYFKDISNLILNKHKETSI